jgi:hypothetical protein
MNIQDSVVSIADNFISVWEYDAAQGWLWFISAAPFPNTLQTIKPKMGYWLETSGQCLWDVSF